jgi:hypothetical protein
MRFPLRATERPPPPFVLKEHPAIACRFMARLMQLGRGPPWRRLATMAARRAGLAASGSRWRAQSTSRGSLSRSSVRSPLSALLVHEEWQREYCLTGARSANEQSGSSLGQTADADFIETGDSRRRFGGAFQCARSVGFQYRFLMARCGTTRVRSAVSRNEPSFAFGCSHTRGHGVYRAE